MWCKIFLIGVLAAGRASAAQVITNPGFEEVPFATGWLGSGSVQVSGLNGSVTAARLPWSTSATLNQTITPQSDFTFDVYFSNAGNNEPAAFTVSLASASGAALSLRTATGGTLQVLDATTWLPLVRISDNAPFNVPNNQTVRLRIIGRGFGTLNAEYDLAWSNPGATTLSHAAHALRIFPMAINTTQPITTLRFDRPASSNNSYTVDDVTLEDGASLPPPPTHQVVLPIPDKVVRISGVYPHLVMTNASEECGIGAIAPFAGSLWAITYSPHSASGTASDKLHQITPNLVRHIRPESIGGTPANRFIHEHTGQLNIGPYFIDASGGVRALSYTTAPGRYTGTAAHLTDPENRLYIFTMENGVYDINVNDLTFITRYPDRQTRGDRFLFGYHGKGAYTGQGLFIVANNGRPQNQNTPLGDAGVLATWDGLTVQQNGGAYLATNDPNNTSEEVTTTPVAAQPAYIAGWNQISKAQHCEVSGPGGISGNKNPTTDPVWATGFDAKSVLLRSLDNGIWSTWRLPKGSYTHDGSHGWHTEWPRIRPLDPEDPDTLYLMHMHGLFFDFPASFSAANPFGLTPISSYYKMPVDYCMFDGHLVIAKNDASRFSNSLTPKAQSNLWFGQPEDLTTWGAPSGHGAIWLNEAVIASQESDPFLVAGFAGGTLHLRNQGATPITLELQATSSTQAWHTVQTIVVPSNGYEYVPRAFTSHEWVRLRALQASSQLTAFFHLASPHPHQTPASLASDEFAAIADIRDTRRISDGLIRVENNAELTMEFASARLDASGQPSVHRYHRVGGPLILNDTNNPTAESTLRNTIATTQDFGFDAASAWVTSGSTRLRIPKLDPAYETPFASGWARGFREVVTERSLLNAHGTFYEVPRANSGGLIKMRALATHGKRITDFASWRGMLAITGVLDDAPASDALLRNADGSTALWLGEVDDLWRMGEPRGTGGPWRDTPVAADAPSDPFLLYGFRQKEVALSHNAPHPVSFSMEIDFLADGTWSTYASFTVPPGETFTHTFPQHFHAHWARLRSAEAVSATAQFTLGPAAARDEFLDWARGHDLPTALGRNAVALLDDDADNLPALGEFYFDEDPSITSTTPSLRGQNSIPHGRQVFFRQRKVRGDVTAVLQTSTSLTSPNWTSHPSLPVAVVDGHSSPTSDLVSITLPIDTPSPIYVRLELRFTP